MSVKWKTWAMVVLIMASAGVASAGSQGTVELKYNNADPAVNATFTHGTQVNQGTRVGVYNLQIRSAGDPEGDGFIDLIADTAVSGAKAQADGSYIIGGFCIDLPQYASYSYLPYGIYALEEAPLGEPMGSRANKLRELFGRNLAEFKTLTAIGQDNRNSYAAAMQAAVWEIVFEETNTTLDVKVGHVSVALTTFYQDKANFWLGTITGTEGAPMNNDLLAFGNANKQDFAIFVPGAGTENPVPEPFTMLTASLAIGGLGMYVRRRSGRSGLAG